MSPATLPGTTADLIAFHDGRPVVLHDGQPVPQSGYCDYIQRGDWEARIREFIDSGVTVFYLNPNRLETSAWWGNAEDAAALATDTTVRTLAAQAEYILSLQPHALFYLRVSATVPAWWGQQNPEEMQTDETGKTYWDPSLPSPRHLAALTEYFHQLVTHCEQQPWSERIVGYLEASYGEGCMPLTFYGKLFDVSAANTTAFRQWISARYATDAALQQAWGDAEVTRNTVRVPLDSAWQAKKQHAVATRGETPAPQNDKGIDTLFHFSGLFHWTEEINAAPERDYCRFMRAAFMQKYRTIARAIKMPAAALGRKRLVGLDITKQPLLGWQIVLAFNGLGAGAEYPAILPLSGSWDVGELLDDEQIDVIFTPADYTARAPGFAFEAEGVSDSLLLRGKTMIIENDARTYIGQGLTEQGAFRNDTEVAAGLLRNAAMTLSRGLQSYWCNVGSSYFHDADIQRHIATTTGMLDRLQTAPHRETREAIAFIIDDESVLREDFTSGFQYTSVVWQRVLGLAHCGLPYRLFLLSDLRKENFPRYHTYFFPNLFTINEDILELLDTRVLRDGNLAIFGPGTGITDGRRLSAAGASALLGIPMELQFRNPSRFVIVQDYSGHPITRELPANLTYGDTLPYGPVLIPAGEFTVEEYGGVPLGHANLCWAINRTGLFLKEFGRGPLGNSIDGPRGSGDFGVLWSAAMPLPANLLRAAARYAGSHIWCEEDDVIYASDSLVAVHSAKSGPRTIKLPRPCTVIDAVSQTLIGDGMTEIPLVIEAPATRIFTLG